METGSVQALPSGWTPAGAPAVEQSLGLSISSLYAFLSCGRLAIASKLLWLWHGVCCCLVFVVSAFWWFQETHSVGLQFGDIR